MSLQDEIDRKAKHIHADGYSMSIGGLISLYRDDELDLHPEFQRFFRWDEHQKSRFVESILIGIPIPSIFVYQREDGVWDVIDGVQRLSTIFELAGILADEEGKPYAPLQLKKTKYLPSLEGMVWNLENEDEEHNGNEFRNSLRMFQRIAFKRKSLDIKIIMDDENDARNELFKRINMEVC